MKKFLKRSLISVLIVMVLFNFLLTPYHAYASASDVIGKIGSSIFHGGLVGILTWIPRLLLLGLVGGLHSLVSSLAQIGEVEGLTASDPGFLVTPFHIFFNKIELVNVNFFDFSSGASDSAIRTFRLAVAGWYYTMRSIAAMALAVILIYIGIRMAISTIASERAMYQKMLVDWVTSLALLFCLHYIMVFVLMINDALVNAMASIAKATDMSDFVTNLVDLAVGDAAATVTLSFVAIGVYSVVVFQTFAFLLSYIKRMLNIGFLIIIAPLITITYSMDKIGDGKAQALNTWLREFSYNILIQPFHCILFLAFAQVAYNLLSQDLSANGSSMARAILAVLCIQYLKTGEELVKQIFGFKNAGSLSSMAAGTAMAMTAMSQAGNVAKKAGAGVSGAARFVNKNPEVQKLKKGIGKGLSKATGNIRSATKTATKSIGKAVSNNKHVKSITKKVETAKSNRQKKKVSDANKRDEEKAYRMAAKRLEARGVKNASPEQIAKEVDSCKKELVKARVDKATKKAENKKIRQEKRQETGRKIREGAKNFAESGVGQALGTVAKVPLGLARDTAKYIGKNKGKLAAGAVGAVVGFGALGAGDFMSAVTGFRAGSGFVQGMVENSTATLKKDARGYADVVSRFSGETSGQNIAVNTYAMGEGGAFKDINKKLEELIEKLRQLGISQGQAANVAGTISKQVHTNPTQVDTAFIENIMTNAGGDFDGLSEGQREQARNLLAGHALLTAQAGLYNNLKNHEQMGRDLDTMGYVIGDFSEDNVESFAGSTYSEETHVEETHTEEEITEEGDESGATPPVSPAEPGEEKGEPAGSKPVEGEPYLDSATMMQAIHEALASTTALSSSESVKPEDISKVNAKIDELNGLLKQFNSETSSGKSQIISAINKNNALLTEFNAKAGTTGELDTGNFEARIKTYIDNLQSEVDRVKRNTES